MTVTTYENEITVCVVSMYMIYGGIWVVVWLPRRRVNVTSVQPKTLFARDWIAPLPRIIGIRRITYWNQSFLFRHVTDFCSGPPTKFRGSNFRTLRGAMSH
jgi:hypothetical protein